MKIIRVFPKRTSFTPIDDYVFIGDPPLERPEGEEVHISCAFTWDKPKAEYLKKVLFAFSWNWFYPIINHSGEVLDD